MTSREQFEAWVRHQFNGRKGFKESLLETMSCGCCYKSRDILLAWDAWQASRDVEIKLPDKVFVEDEFDKGHNFGIEYCAEAIAEAGFRVKGG